MRFKPGERIVFLTADGAEIVVRPFFYTNSTETGVQIELRTDEGTCLKCIDADGGLYSLEGSDSIIRLKPSSKSN